MIKRVEFGVWRVELGIRSEELGVPREGEWGKKCHPERPEGAEGSWHLPTAYSHVRAKILRRASLAQDDRFL